LRQKVTVRTWVNSSWCARSPNL